jgi:hypothetical protein
LNSFGQLFVGWAMLAGFAALHQDQKYTEYLTAEGDQRHLKNRLVLRDEVRGFAGLSGRMWVVEPDGRWSVVVLRPAGTGKVKEVTQQTGQFTPGDLIALAKDLATHDLAGLPVEHGERAKINPHRMVLKYGDKEMVINGIIPRRKNETMREIIAKSAPSQDTVGATVWARWGALAHAIESRTGSPKQ